MTDGLSKASQIRNIAILGHQGSGKTTLSESLYAVSAKKDAKGSVEKKNTISDFLPEEQKRLSSVSTSLVPCEYQGYRFNILDVPGNDDFISEVYSATSVVKGAVLCLDASASVEVGTIRHYEILRQKNIPTLIFVNKMDKENVHFDQVLEDIREKLGKNAIPFCYPLGHENSFDGFINVVERKARIFNGKECVDSDVHEDKKDKMEELYNVICEAVAQTDDVLLEKYCAEEPLTQEEIKTGLRKGVLEGELVPVLVGCATKNIGVQTMLEMFKDYLPDPSDLKPLHGKDGSGKEVERKTDENEPFSALVFKTTCDAYAGTISYVKIISGVLNVGEEVYIPNEDRSEKVNTMFHLLGKTQTPVQQAFAGDIVGLSKVDLKSGQTLCNPKNVITYKGIDYPSACIFKGFVVKSKNDEGKLNTALQKLQLEDPSIEYRRNPETNQLLVGGLSATHLDYLASKLLNIYRIDITTEEEKICYRESITRQANGDGRYVKQSGGSGFYGVVAMTFEPTEESTFEETVFGGAVPKNYFPAVEKGFYEALEHGLLAGFPVIGVKGILTDGKYHPVDSNELAFKMAAILAFKDAYMKCKPVILEPIDMVVVSVHQQYIGDILSDLNTRRGRVQSIDDGENGRQEVTALVPESEIKDYATRLKAMTQGMGYFTRKFESYDRLPEMLNDKVIKENSTLKKD